MPKFVKVRFFVNFCKFMRFFANFIYIKAQVYMDAWLKKSPFCHVVCLLWGVKKG